MNHRRDDAQRVLEAGGEMIERIAEHREFRLVPARAEAQDQPTAAHLVDCIGHLGKECRVAERRAHDQRSQLDASRRLRQSRKQRPGLPDTTSLTIPLEEEMVGDPDRVELIALHLEYRDADFAVAQDRPAVCLGDRQHDPDLHIDSSIPSRQQPQLPNGVKPAALYVAWSENAKTPHIVDRVG